MEGKGYSASQVCKILGLGYSKLDYWARSGFLVPSLVDAKGRGSTRLYSFPDLVAAKVALTLQKDGVTLQKLRKVVSYLHKESDLENQSLAGLMLLTDGKKVFHLLKNDSSTLVDILKGGQIIFIIGLEKIVKQLKQRVVKLNRVEVSRKENGKEESEVA